MSDYDMIISAAGRPMGTVLRRSPGVRIEIADLPRTRPVDGR